MNIIEMALWMKKNNIKEISITSDMQADGVAFIRKETYGATTSFNVMSDTARDMMAEGSNVTVVDHYGE